MVDAIAATALMEAVRQGATTSTFRDFRVHAVCIGVVPAGDGRSRNVWLAVRSAAAVFEACVVVDACEVGREPTLFAHGLLD